MSTTEEDSRSAAPRAPEAGPLRLADLFGAALRERRPRPGGLDTLLESAHAFDDVHAFTSAADRWAEAGSAAARPEMRAALAGAILREARRLEDLAGTGSSFSTPAPETDPARLPMVMGGQQAYIDYTPGVLAKLDALDEVRDSARAGGRPCLAWYALLDYDAFGSDLLISRTDLPRAEPLGERLPVLRWQVHGGARRHRFQDMRRIPPPSRQELRRGLDALHAQAAYASRRLPSSDPRRVRRHLAELGESYETARRRARHVGEFNAIWSLLHFRRLGFRSPCVRLGELTADPALRPAFASLLAPFLRRNEDFVGAITDAVDDADGFDLLIGRRPAGYLPLRLTDGPSGRRFPLALERRGRDFWLVGRPGTGLDHFEESVGAGRAEELESFLERHADAWTFDVFLPVFLFRLGLDGLINGKGSMRYSLVVGRVLEALFGHRHPPNLLCAGRHGSDGLLVEAVRHRRGDLPPEVASLEATLVGLGLHMDPAEIRRAVRAAWRDPRAARRPGDPERGDA